MMQKGTNHRWLMTRQEQEKRVINRNNQARVAREKMLKAAKEGAD
jgi:hypothetical protein